MKKIIAFLISLILMVSLLSSVAFGEDEAWVCPSCGMESTWNFCPNCGAKKPEPVPEGGADASEGFQVDIHVDFDENMMFSTYAVNMYIDDELVDKLSHGKDYDGTVTLSSGKHTVKFAKAGSSSVTGSCEIEITGPSSFSCNIHAYSERVSVSYVKVTPTSSRALPNSETPAGEGAASSGTYVVIDPAGEAELDLAIDFRTNAMFSTYSVDLYCDDVFVLTLGHGEDYHGTLKVSEGIHTIHFYKNGDKSVKGKCEFSVVGKTSFSCHIEATRNEVEVSRQKRNNGNDGLYDKASYIKECTTIQYKSIERNPEQYKGAHIKVTGTVIQVVESGSSSVIMRVMDANDDIWYVTYKRADGEGRILEDDQITLYGACKGVVTYSSTWGGSVTIPGVDAVFVEVK